MTAVVYKGDKTWPPPENGAEILQVLCKKVLPERLYDFRWFAGKAGTIGEVRIDDRITLESEEESYLLLLIEVLFKESYAQHYFLPLAIHRGSKPPAESVFLKLSPKSAGSYLIDALHHPGFRRLLYTCLISNSRVNSGAGALRFKSKKKLPSDAAPDTRILNAEQSNSTLVINERLYLKIFRRLFRDKNPDFEMNEFLAGQKYFSNYPPLRGLISWQTQQGYEVSLGLMQEKVENSGTAWDWMLTELPQFFGAGNAALDDDDQRLFTMVRKLAHRTAEMHIALSRERRDRRFVPVEYNGDFSVWLKNRLIYQFDARYNLLKRKLRQLKKHSREMGQAVIDQKDFIINFILSFDEEELKSERIRIHGDYHLGQILMHEDDFYILDFEGEPESTIRDRQVKQSPLKDVAGLFRSFHYALFVVLKNSHQSGSIPEKEINLARHMYQRMTSSFMEEYQQLAFNNQLDIGYQQEIDFLLQYFLLEKAIYELGYELNGRPDWAVIPLRGILEIINEIKSYGKPG